MKHAIMIMAHGDYDQLRNLVCLFDYENIDVYIHINKRSRDWNDRLVEGLTKHSEIHIVERISVSYCDYSQIKAQMSLLNSATKSGYDYYHILSGADLPLHPIPEIFKFFEKNRGLEFVGFCQNYDTRKAGIKAFFQNKVRTTHGFAHKAYVKASKFIERMQLRLGVNLAKGYDGKPMKGYDWWSITDAAARYVIDNEPNFRRYFKKCYCPSELLMQTLLYNSVFKERLYNSEDENIGSCRNIDWRRGQPYVWRKEDFDDLINSSCMFARKFSPSVDNEIIDLIINHVRQ